MHVPPQLRERVTRVPRDPAGLPFERRVLAQARGSPQSRTSFTDASKQAANVDFFSVFFAAVSSSLHASAFLCALRWANLSAKTG